MSTGKFLVRLVTGAIRGSGTPLQVCVQIVGSQASSDKVALQDLARGSVRAVEVTAPQELGEIQSLLVEREAAESVLGADWYLSQVELVTPSGQSLTFPCNSWFGRNELSTDGTGALARHLLPASALAALGSQAETLRPSAISIGGMAIPHPDKVRHQGVRGVVKQGWGHAGEDAMFYCPNGQGIFGLGVADGVYMWKTLGIDSGEMSRAVMRAAAHLIQNEGITDVSQVLKGAAAAAAGILGSTTVCLAIADTVRGVLRVANLGDSGMCLLSPPKDSGEYFIRHRTVQLEHEFGRPFQLGSHETADSPAAAEVLHLPIAPGDVIVLGTDGLFDNVSDGELTAVVTEARRRNLSASALCQAITKAAFESSMSKSKVTPYSLAASEAFDMVYNGGKKDDITVVAAYLD